MGDGVGERFAQGADGVLRDVAAQEALDQRGLAQGAEHVDLGFLDHLGDGALEAPVIHESGTLGRLFLAGRPEVLQEGDHQLREELLGVLAENQEPCEGRSQNGAVAGDDVEALEHFGAIAVQVVGAGAGAAEVFEVAIEARGVEVVDGGTGDELFVVAGLAAGAEVAEDLVLAHLAVGIGDAEVGALGQAVVLEEAGLLFDGSLVDLSSHDDVAIDLVDSEARAEGRFHLVGGEVCHLLLQPVRVRDADHAEVGLLRSTRTG